jgi:hypothetical protein
MSRGLCRFGLLAAIVLGASGSSCRAQTPYQGFGAAPYYAAGPFQSRRGIGHRAWWGGGGRYGGMVNPGRGPSYSPGGIGPGFVPGLPRGRRYYGGRYFGSINDRFYSPQYGYF